MNELIYISNKSEAMIFKAIGFEVFIVENEKNVLDLIKNNYSTVKIIGFDSQFRSIISEIKKEEHIYPIFLEIPLDKSNIGGKTNEIKEKIKKSIGIDLL